MPSAKISVNVDAFQQNGSKLRTQLVNHKLLKNWKYSVTAGRIKRVNDEMSEANLRLTICHVMKATDPPPTDRESGA